MLTKLNPWVVSLHFIVSAAMVMAATLLVNRTGALRRGETSLGKPAGTTQQFLAWTILATSALAIVLGTIVTGTGPHAGDADSPRHLLRPVLRHPPARGPGVPAGCGNPDRPVPGDCATTRTGSCAPR